MHVYADLSSSLYMSCYYLTIHMEQPGFHRVQIYRVYPCILYYVT